ncbi:hypothetical protein [Yoonia vestfoldensis]|uniref:hypothetical protein n=1 Tax=Yoonia vestfoldensis TaxID=245188 RepID=UPI00037F0CE0|nr:hypothetical protein [Yoonia vestfoldensis]
MSVGLATSAIQSDGSFGYRAEIVTDDMVNSNGERLEDLAAILQQDRANYHRFDIRQDGDETDPFFDDFQTRARMQVVYKPGPRDAEIESLLAFGAIIRLDVEVCLRNGRPVQIGIRYSDTDGTICG